MPAVCDENQAFKRSFKTPLFVKFVDGSTLAIWFDWPLLTRMSSWQFVVHINRVNYKHWKTEHYDRWCLAPCVARYQQSWYWLCNKRVPIIEKWFHLPVLYQYWENIENETHVVCNQINSVWKWLNIMELLALVPFTLIMRTYHFSPGKPLVCWCKCDSVAEWQRSPSCLNGGP